MKIIITLLSILMLACSPKKDAPTHTSESSGRWVAWSTQPADRLEDTFVTGNGRHGTMVWGQPNDERITLVHEELFIRGWDHNKQTVPVTASLLPEMRKLINEGNSNEASALIANEANKQLIEMGAEQRWPLIPHPAFDIRIKYNNEANSDYRRQLDLETGVATVMSNGGDGITQNVFSSREHNINVIRLKAGQNSKINIVLGLEETPGREGDHFEHSLDNAFEFVEKETTPGWLSYRAAYNNNPGGYEGLARVTLTGGEMKQDGSNLTIENADEVLVLVRISPLEDGNKSIEKEVKKELTKLSNNYDNLLAPHINKHSDMFNRMQLDLGRADEWKEISTDQMLETIHEEGVSPLFMEQMHAMGRYLLISSSGKYAPALQGIWSGGWKPGWIGGFVWDSNINLAISAASMSNLEECAESYCNYVESLLPGWRLNAKNYLGMRGFIVAHYNDPENGYLTHFGPSFPWMCWAGGAGWNLRPFYEYAMFMGDDDALKNRVLPLYKEIADFYEDFLVLGDDNLYHIIPSISPENAPNGNNTWLSIDATMDVAIAKDVFGILIDMGNKFDLPQQDIDKWSNYLEKLPEYRINEDGALAEWIDPTYLDIYDHRHLSHLYPVFPGTQISKSKGDPTLIQAAKVALDKRYEFDTSSAHGLIHVALKAVRLGDIDKVVKNLDRFSRRNYIYKGLVTSHDPNHTVYNLDANLSLPRLFMEMLVYTEPGKVELLPAWPKEYSDGSLKGVRLYGGHTLDISWKDGELADCTLYANTSGEYEITYQGTIKQVELEKGKSYNLSNLE